MMELKNKKSIGRCQETLPLQSKKPENFVPSHRGRKRGRIQKGPLTMRISRQNGNDNFNVRLEPLLVMEENSKSNSPEQATTPASGDDTDVSPPSEQVTESGTFADQWIETKCAFCLQELRDVNEPKLLNCLHTACKSCLSAESAPSPAPSSSGLGLSAKHLTCPSCSQEINPNDVVDHLFLLEHLSQNTEGLAEESKSYPCSCDEGSEATGFCTDCQEWLCVACVTAHHRVRVTKDHIIRSKDDMEGEKALTGLSQKYLFCPVHSHEPLKLYCESCDKLTCRDCQLSDHKEHKYQFLTNACEEEKSSLSMILGKIKEKEQHIQTACDLVTRRHKEISQRENAVTQEIKTFAVKFITEINKRGKQLLQELAEVCSEKKTQLSYKNQELVNMSEKLKFCKKFSEAALAHGSETALVYSKKVIISQLKRILKHRCEVPNPSHNVDITFSYEGNYLTQYISQLGTLLVDQEPVPRVSLSSTPQQQPPPPPQQQMQHQPQQAAPHQMQPGRMQQPVMNQNMNMQISRQSNQLIPATRGLQDMHQMQMQQKQQQMQMQQQKQQFQRQQQSNQMQMQKQQQMQKQPPQYGQPQVTSSTDNAQNRNVGAMRPMMNNNNQMAPYMRSPVQRGMNSNVSQSQNQNYPVSNNSYSQQQQQRHVTPQQTPARQQPVQQPVQQPSFNQQVSLPAPLMHNSNITISPIAGPTPPKQRALTPRQNVQLSPLSKGGMQQRIGGQQQQRSSQPQVIEIDGDGPSNRKTPTMSNTSRLSHFPNTAAAAISALPGIQLQPISNNSNYHNNSRQALEEMLQRNAIWAESCENSSKTNADVCSSQLPTMQTSTIEAENSLDQFTENMIGVFTENHQLYQKEASEEAPIHQENDTESCQQSSLMTACDSTASTSSYTLSASTSSYSSSTSTSSYALSASTSSYSIPISSPSASSSVECSSIKRKNGDEEDSLSDLSLDNFPTREDVFGKEGEKIIIVPAEGEKSSITLRVKEPVDPNDDYCAVCKEGGDVVCCSQCPRVFHAPCHIPGLAEIPENDFLCRLCEDVKALAEDENKSKKRRRFGIPGRDLIFCERILLEIFCHEVSPPFHMKVHKATPNYYAIIKKPMDLSAISSRLRVRFDYYQRVSEFVADIRLIFSNCRTYNKLGSELYAKSLVLEEFFDSLLREYLPSFVNNESVIENNLVNASQEKEKADTS